MKQRTSQLAGGIGVVVSMLVSFWAIPLEAQTVEGVSRLMSDWQIEEAGRMLGEVESAQGETPAVQFLKARYDFLQGRYDRASGRLDSLFESAEVRGEWREFQTLLEATREATKEYEKHTSESGRFEIYVEPGKDRVVVPYASEALDKAYEAIGDRLGYRPETPIRVEVYPRTSTLAQVSGLTEEEIRRSGTIALCKYNRLMITSPKALLRGYGWVDTLIHEYVHYVINQKTANRVPIWMHEGLAKYLEHSWRGPDAHHLPPSTEHLLSKRVEDGDLISFEEMHPSMAKLPSQEDAATAFAEVYTVMEYLEKNAGESAFRKLLDAVSKVDDPRAAFGEVLGEDFATFDREWRAYLNERETPGLPDEYGYKNKLVFKDEEGESDEMEEFETPKAKDHMRLGEMLQQNNRYEAAVVEYRKAVRMTEAPNPKLRTRLAQSLTKVGKPKEALEVLEPAKRMYPTYVGVWVELGEANLRAGHPDRAIEALREAARINPFDPRVHELSAEAYGEMGNEEEADRARKFAKLVQ